MNEGGEEMDVRMIGDAATAEPVVAAGGALRVERHERADPDTAIQVVFDVRGLSVYYGDFRAISDVTLPVYRHRITALIGPSGCTATARAMQSRCC